MSGRCLTLSGWGWRVDPHGPFVSVRVPVSAEVGGRRRRRAKNNGKLGEIKSYDTGDNDGDSCEFLPR